jgi:hypothetical protein
MNLDELERLAENATPGPWLATCRHADGPKDLQGISKWPDDEYLGCEVNGPSYPYGRGEYFGRDAAYIAAMSPDTALKLIKVARAAKASYKRIDYIGCVDDEHELTKALGEALKELEA